MKKLDKDSLTDQYNLFECNHSGHNKCKRCNICQTCLDETMKDTKLLKIIFPPGTHYCKPIKSGPVMKFKRYADQEI